MAEKKTTISGNAEILTEANIKKEFNAIKRMFKSIKDDDRTDHRGSRVPESRYESSKGGHDPSRLADNNEKRVTEICQRKSGGTDV